MTYTSWNDAYKYLINNDYHLEEDFTITPNKNKFWTSRNEQDAIDYLVKEHHFKWCDSHKAGANMESKMAYDKAPERLNLGRQNVSDREIELNEMAASCFEKAVNRHDQGNALGQATREQTVDEFITRKIWDNEQKNHALRELHRQLTVQFLQQPCGRLQGLLKD